MEITGYTRMAAVIATPIKHSLSPFIHNLAFKETGENGVYLAWEVNEKDLIQVLHNIRSLNMYGVNLSMPYKSLAMWFPENLSERAKLIGAINTIVNEDGKLTGHNTDGIGFFKSLEDENFFPEDKVITILGGGGAALAIITEAALKKAKKINVFARKSPSYNLLAKKIQTLSSLIGTEIQLFDLNDQNLLNGLLNESQLFINATSVGMDGSSIPINDDIQIESNLLVADVIYKSKVTPLLRWADSQNLRRVNGLGMLVYQAAESFKLWTGKDMPVKLIKDELSKKLY
ncbi:shikimate dehydrogenase [Lactovum miscens]|uniref:Shikimate dehydrogenase (NADP(+)) n=1 Tax=Lactovum miscens TaxID=190387 RepID=A0A841C954_9LACT|nr:shikimate dehydrogenase [Lactovum miscens]MBB5888122.1 shikimate dehydrogenase [Lactovum miscens]